LDRCAVFEGLVADLAFGTFGRAGLAGTVDAGLLAVAELVVHAVRIFDALGTGALVDRVEAHLAFGAGVRTGLTQPSVAGRLAVAVLAAFAILVGSALGFDAPVELLDAHLVSTTCRVVVHFADVALPVALLDAIAVDPVVAVVIVVARSDPAIALVFAAGLCRVAWIKPGCAVAGGRATLKAVAEHPVVANVIVAARGERARLGFLVADLVIGARGLSPAHAFIAHLLTVTVHSVIIAVYVGGTLGLDAVVDLFDTDLARGTPCSVVGLAETRPALLIAVTEQGIVALVVV